MYDMGPPPSAGPHGMYGDLNSSYTDPYCMPPPAAHHHRLAHVSTPCLPSPSGYLHHYLYNPGVIYQAIWSRQISHTFSPNSAYMFYAGSKNTYNLNTSNLSCRLVDQ